MTPQFAFTIVGPASRGATFKVHAAGCRDLASRSYAGEQMVDAVAVDGLTAALAFANADDLGYTADDVAVYPCCQRAPVAGAPDTSAPWPAVAALPPAEAVEARRLEWVRWMDGEGPEPVRLPTDWRPSPEYLRLAMLVFEGLGCFDERGRLSCWKREAGDLIRETLPHLVAAKHLRPVSGGPGTYGHVDYFRTSPDEEAKRLRESECARCFHTHAAHGGGCNCSKCPCEHFITEFGGGA